MPSIGLFVGDVAQEGLDTPTIGCDGLLRPAEAVARLKARDQGEGGASWTSPERTSAPDRDDGGLSADVLDRVAGDEPPRGVGGAGRRR